ncbi:phospholipase a1 precursor [hydrocarbon metagenome]|uniref:Phosphatidylcholine 1-acylhydrolase n=1 Tax=hydrocarbon metagenome TaxID=938273 RepID=A0A0W8FQ74_9ZZZZ
MKIIKTEKTFKIMLTCILFLLLAVLPLNAAEIDKGLANCAKLKDDTERLKCFDELARRQIPLRESVILKSPEEETQESAIVDKTTTPPPEAEEKYFSVMEKQWDLRSDKPKEKNIFVLWPYRPCFFLPLAYNSSPNDSTQLDVDPKAKALYNEVKFQLSFKFKIWRDIIRSEEINKIIERSTGIRGIDVWIAYTQQSFWQLYNSAFSAPFRDTNYEPELLINFDMQRKIPGLMGTKLQFINIGFNHQSNGRAEPLSRSWNRIVANVGLENNFGLGKNDNFSLLLKTWYRVPEDAVNDDNPDLTDYMGYGELWGTLYWRNQRIAVMLRNNLRSENKGAVQLDWSMPLSTIHESLAKKISLYVQYFNGYGESLLDYNTSINRISAGLMLVDWR